MMPRGPGLLFGHSILIMVLISVVMVLVAKSCPTLVTSWTHEAPLSMGFPRQAYWSGLLFPSTGNRNRSGIRPHLLPDRRILYC